MKYRVHIRIEREVVIEVDDEFDHYSEVQAAGIAAGVSTEVILPGDLVHEPWVENVREYND